MSQVQYPSEFEGGPYDGVVFFLSQPFREILQPRGAAAFEKIDPNEAEFNVSMTGRPFKKDVTYERYTITNRIVVKDIVFAEGTMKNVRVMIYGYEGVVGGDDQSKQDITLL